MSHYECIVVGGGLIGATVALGLARQGRWVALIETQPPTSFVVAPPDLRVSALNLGTIALLSELQAWPAIAALRCTPFQKLMVWEQGWEEKTVCFSAELFQQPLLGYMVENSVLQAGLWDCLSSYPNLHRYVPASLQWLQPNERGWQLQLKNGQKLTTALVVAADGQASPTRQQAGISVSGWQYHQHCLLISVKSQQPQQNITWQCFYPNGPRAFLPLNQPWASLAWYDTPTAVGRLSHLPLPLLTEAIQHAYPERLGRVTAVAAQAFPLVSQRADTDYLPGLAVVGDAAHTIHPLAGQGANLGFRDVACLLKRLAPLASLENCSALTPILQQYQRQRLWDNRLMQWGMHGLAEGFRGQQAPLRWLRKRALGSVEAIPWLKQQLLRYALGVAR